MNDKDNNNRYNKNSYLRKLKLRPISSIKRKFFSKC